MACKLQSGRRGACLSAEMRMAVIVLEQPYFGRLLRREPQQAVFEIAPVASVGKRQPPHPGWSEISSETAEGCTTG